MNPVGFSTRVCAFTAAALFVAGGVASTAFAKVDLKARFSQTARYWLEDNRLRHQTSELNLRQTADVREGVTTVVEGRFRYESAILPPDATRLREYPKAVQDDEGFESEARQIYLDWLTNVAAIKVGVVQFDWMDSLSPRTSDSITALDLRHGGFDSASQIIEPVFAASGNFSLGFGSLEMMVVPHGKPHRLPKGENGYGYGERVNGLLGGVSQALKQAGLRGNIDSQRQSPGIPAGGKDIEFGGRFLANVEGFDLSFIGWRGHQRTPTLDVSLYDSPDATATNPDWILAAAETHVRMNTYAAFLGYGGDAAVVRLFSIYEPGRRPAVLVEDDLAWTLLGQLPADEAYATGELLFGDEAYRRGAVLDRTRTGAGFDYVFSKHLKVYSEAYVTRSRVTGNTLGGQGIEDSWRDHTGTLRITNESFDDLFMSCDVTMTGPERSWLVSPDVTYEWREGAKSARAGASSWKMSFGGWLVQSESDKSSLRILRGARQVYARLTAWL
ncbi:MAG: hypothetical protein RIQ81_1092 [Pseudomonadota bacterium]